MKILENETATAPGATPGNAIKHPARTVFITGWRKEILELRIRLTIITLVVAVVPMKNWIRTLRQLDKVRRQYFGDSKVKKIARISGRYYWDLYVPGWPSTAFNNFIKAEINRIYPIPGDTNRLSNTILAVTKKCSLQCDHCFEWDRLSKTERLSTAEIQQIVHTIQRHGCAQIHLSGGEPMLRFEAVMDVLRTADRTSDFWLLTAGLHLTAGHATKLRAAGLTGVMVSLDHYDEDAHNEFRHSRQAYHWAAHAVANAQRAGLVVGLSVCVVRDLATATHLHRYMTLAKSWGVAFVQILEPKAVGHYGGKDVTLSAAHQKVIDDCFLKFNFSDACRHHPIISYHGYYQRRTGCFAAGDRNIYIDSNGHFHACPFCQKETGNALVDDFTDCLGELKNHGCHRFNGATI